MPSIDLDDQTAAGLSALAAARGISVESYLRLIAQGKASNGASAPGDFTEQLDELLFDAVSPLPRDFSRVDIYSDHD